MSTSTSERLWNSPGGLSAMVFVIAVIAAVLLEFALAGSFGRDPSLAFATSRGVAIGIGMAIVFYTIGQNQ